VDEPLRVEPETESDELLFAIPDTVAELLGEPLVADPPVAEQVEVPVVPPVHAPVPELAADDEQVRFTGSDYVFYGLVTVGALAATGVVALVGYVIYTLVMSVFGAVASGAAMVAGVFPLLVLAGVVALCARGRGGARAAGLPLPGVGSASAGVLNTVSGVAALAGPIPRLFGRGVRGRSVVADSAGVAPVRRSRWRGGRTVRDVTVSDVAARPVLDRVLGVGLPSEQALGVAEPGTPLSWRARVVARRAQAQAQASAPHRAGVVSAAWSRVSGRRAVDALGVPVSVPHRGVVASLVFGSGARGAAAAVGSVPRRSGLSARVLGAGSVAVNAHGEPVQGRFSMLLFGPASPTAQLAALANGRRADGLAGWLRDVTRPRGRVVPSSDIPLEHLVIVDSLTQRWIDRLRAATPKDLVYGSWMDDSMGRCRFCAVGFLWDEFDSDRWFVQSRSRMFGGFKRWYHRDASLMFRTYSPKFLWHISNMHDSGEWSTHQVANFVEQVVLRGKDADAFSG
jgi:hypothetical protein